MPKLILIRHGQSMFNAGDTVQGSDPDPTNTLNEEGKKQAKRFGQLLRDRKVRPASVWSSPLVRARQTCTICLRIMGCRLRVRQDPRLEEMCKGRRDLPGGLEGRRSDEVKTPAYREQQRRQGWQFRHGSLKSHGETPREAGRRFLAAMNEIADSVPINGIALVFAHGQSIRYGVGAALGFPAINTIDTEYRLGNCESLIVDRSARRQWRVVERLSIV